VDAVLLLVRAAARRFFEREAKRRSRASQGCRASPEASKQQGTCTAARFVVAFPICL
jgi:hypothetical protein